MLALTLVLLSLSGEIGRPQGVRLLDDAPLLAQLDAPPPMVPASDAQVSAQQLQVDLDALKRQRPSIGGGITLVIAGGSAAIIGALYMGISSIGFFGGINPFLILGAVALGIGLPLVVIGVWLLYNRLEERKVIDEETARLKKELRLRGPVSPPQQRYSPQPPSVEVPPPQVLGPGPAPSMMIARF